MITFYIVSIGAGIGYMITYNSTISDIYNTAIGHDALSKLMLQLGVDDNGYDIRDYYKIMEEFGTMSDFDETLREIYS